MKRLRFGYNTNGFAHHSIEDAIEILAELGYDGIAITVDHNHCNILKTTDEEIASLSRILEQRGLKVVVETGARYFLDRWRKHEPGFVSNEGREERITFTKKAIDLGKTLQAEAITICSGRLSPQVDAELAWPILVQGLADVAEYADKQGMNIALEPEPGMYIDDLTEYDRLCEEPLLKDRLHLALDIGHVRCSETRSIEEAILTYRDRIKTIHIEDIKGDVHEHLFFGDGDIDFQPVMNALSQISFEGLINVELSRDSHRAVEMAIKSIGFLHRYNKKERQ
ncbi:sugar phosphate isomerase/epimerase family protein [Geotalea uraniireducens]|uniref:Xylose isomerase domain protein TIM barrel n=1 Tax=Geotalea uraniireducens (strain Rf4) TaxID=351605 RepID=A5G4I2_GEOUR|nr:sugar phosphate isomerase/epimerase family protein [Geotalea uraniireducens]ABQ26700.1 Xylose isomerase domain protein TIM barrel [Geotalea uraniireducens Rf4]